MTDDEIRRATEIHAILSPLYLAANYDSLKWRECIRAWLALYNVPAIVISEVIEIAEDYARDESLAAAEHCREYD